MTRTTASKRPYAPLAVLGFALAVAAVVAAVAAGFGTKAGLWDYRMGFTILRWAAWGGLIAAAVALIGCFTAPSGGARRGLALAASGAVLGVLTFAVPWASLTNARAAPRVWDVTTDTENPPQFVAAVKLRGNVPNKPAYRGGDFARIQKTAYPDIRPLAVPLPPAEAYRAALEAARAEGWEIVAEAPAEGRIEAVATTFWFGFKDDVAIRVARADDGSRVDIRSYSRLGRNDAGANARRVRAFLARLAAATGGR